MARRDSAGVRLLTRNGHDFTTRFLLAAAAVTALPGRSATCRQRVTQNLTVAEKARDDLLFNGTGDV
jgi:hypothetical protein